MKSTSVTVPSTSPAILVEEPEYANHVGISYDNHMYLNGTRIKKDMEYVDVPIGDNDIELPTINVTHSADVHQGDSN